MTSRPLFYGVLCALGAGLLWGLVFVAPVILDDYPPVMLAFGRYLAFGVIALALRSHGKLARLERCDWLAALELSFVGNILYYLCLAAAIQLAGAPLPIMIIGTLPLVIAVVSNLHEGMLPWRRLAPSLGVIGLGVVLVNQHEVARLNGAMPDGYGVGIVLALVANACWTWYPVRNSRWLKRRPQISSDVWATAQGLATLPLALIGMALAGLWFSRGGHFDFPLGPRPWLYVGLMLTIGLLASWLGTLLWNRASQLLPTALAGQLIVFETLSAFLYAFLWRGDAPGSLALAGLVLLVLGVMLGVRAFRKKCQE